VHPLRGLQAGEHGMTGFLIAVAIVVPLATIMACLARTMERMAWWSTVGLLLIQVAFAVILILAAQ
jgi:hypothetical protein